MYNISIVLYRNSHEDLVKLVNAILRSKYLKNLVLVDNCAGYNKKITEIGNTKLIYVDAEKNGGYGYGHNIALKLSISDPNVTHHFVINSDIEFENQLFDLMYDRYANDELTAIVTPRVNGNDGLEQLTAKYIPTPYHLIKKRILYHFFKVDEVSFGLPHQYLARSKVFAPYLSGCFMCINKRALQFEGLFDERFFMYPEDLDLTRRMFRNHYCLQDRDFVITHHFEGSSRKNLRMFIIHAVNMIKYFNKYGWIYDREAKMLNSKGTYQNEHHKDS